MNALRELSVGPCKGNGIMFRCGLCVLSGITGTSISAGYTVPTDDVILWASMFLHTSLMDADLLDRLMPLVLVFFLLNDVSLYMQICLAVPYCFMPGNIIY